MDIQTKIEKSREGIKKFISERTCEESSIANQMFRLVSISSDQNQTNCVFHQHGTNTWFKTFLYLNYVSVQAFELLDEGSVEIELQTILGYLRH